MHNFEDLPFTNTSPPKPIGDNGVYQGMFYGPGFDYFLSPSGFVHTNHETAGPDPDSFNDYAALFDGIPEDAYIMSATPGGRFNFEGGWFVNAYSPGDVGSTSILIKGYREGFGGTLVQASTFTIATKDQYGYFDAGGLYNDIAFLEIVGGPIPNPNNPSQIFPTSYFAMDDLTFTPVPEPASLATIGIVGVAVILRRRRIPLFNTGPV